MIVELPNGSKVEFRDSNERNPYQSKVVDPRFAVIRGGWADVIIAVDDDYDESVERVISEAKARNIPNVINLGYKEETK